MAAPSLTPSPPSTSQGQVSQSNPKLFLLGGRHRTPLGTPIVWPGLEPIVVRLFRRSRLCEYLLEICSLFRRILLLRDAPKFEVPYRRLLVDLGPEWVEHPSGHLVRCTPTLGRSEDIQTFSSICRWATPIDHAVFLEGWDAGARWAADNLYSGSEDRGVKGEP
jgi:hypothetical protein